MVLKKLDHRYDVLMVANRNIKDSEIIIPITGIEILLYLYSYLQNCEIQNENFEILLNNQYFQLINFFFSCDMCI